MREARATNSDQKNKGKIVEIKGVVIDAVFTGELPQINTALAIESRARRRGATLIAEVQQHLGDDRVRAVAMDSTDGLARGIDVVDTGAADLRAGRRRDARPPLERARRAGRQEGAPPADAERWPIHRDPPSFRDLSPTIEIFETGIKVIDLIAPYVQGGKVGLFGGAGVGKTVLIQELIHNVARAARRRLGLRRRRRAHARGQRPLARDGGVGRARQGRARLRADERAAGRAPARRPLRA